MYGVPIKMKLTRQKLRTIILESLPSAEDPQKLDMLANMLTSHKDPSTVRQAFEVAIGLGHGQAGSFSVIDGIFSPIFGMTVSKGLFRAMQKYITIHHFKYDPATRMYKIGF